MRTVIEDEEQDREVTLGMASLLGIFFGLAMLCGAIFGVGYSMGRHSSPPAHISTTGSSSDNAAAESSTPQEIPAANTHTSYASPHDSSSEQAPAATRPPALQPAIATRTPAIRKPAAATQAVVDNTAQPSASRTPTEMVTPAATAPMMVQIAAVSHQEDAQILVSALRQHGYNVSVRSEPQDKLLHVQLGPFATREAAKTMRTRLLASGYNAIIKP